MKAKDFLPIPDLESARCLLCVQPHPDDNEVGAGGTICKLARAGARVIYVTVTDGGMGSTNPARSREEVARIRRAEAERSAQYLGAESLVWLDYPDGGAPAGEELVRRLVQVIRREKPDAVLTVDPWLPYEAHPDHLHTGMAAAQACLFSGFPLFAAAQPPEPAPPAPGSVRETTEPAPHQVSMVAFYGTSRPNTIVNVDATWEEKLAAIKMHESQFAGIWDPYAAYFTTKARELAKEHIFSLGEAFKVLTPQHLHFFVDTERR